MRSSQAQNTIELISGQVLHCYIIPFFSPAHIGGKEDLGLSKKTALRAVLPMQMTETSYDK